MFLTAPLAVGLLVSKTGTRALFISLFYIFGIALFEFISFLMVLMVLVFLITLFLRLFPFLSVFKVVMWVRLPGEAEAQRNAMETSYFSAVNMDSLRPFLTTELLKRY